MKQNSVYRNPEVMGVRVKSIFYIKMRNVDLTLLLFVIGKTIGNVYTELLTILAI